jgi:hypothetical protein
VYTYLLRVADDITEAIIRRLKTLVLATTLLLLLPAARTQVSITIGGPPPVCTYGYYSYTPYACAPYGYYGPGYFYNGIFLGVGPWRHWGYTHGWVISAITREGMAVVTRHHRPMVEGNRPTAVVADHPVEVEANRQVVAVVVGPQASGRLRAC